MPIKGGENVSVLLWCADVSFQMPVKYYPSFFMNVETSLLESVESSDIINLVQKKLTTDNITNHLTIETPRLPGASVGLCDAHSMLIGFPTLSEDAKPYRLLFLTDVRRAHDLGDDTRIALQQIMNRMLVDRVVLWMTDQPEASTTQLLKQKNIDVLYLHADDFRRMGYIARYYPLPEQDHKYVAAVNATADLIVRRLKKYFHQVLSEVAAPVYDEEYGAHSVATQESMAYEEQILHRLVQVVKANVGAGEAIDVGCGTGRHSFIMADHFETVHAFDFSPKMIEEAHRKQAKRGASNIEFFVGDAEHGSLVGEKDFALSCSLVVASFGMGSFVEDTTYLLRRISNWMVEGGYVLLSFYNERSILLSMEPNWRDTALSADLNVHQDTLRVQLTDEAVFDIFCKPFSEETKSEIDKKFEVLELHRYPTLMALMPNSLLQDPSAVELFGYLDEHLAEHDQFSLGHYVTIVARKPESQVDGYKQVVDVLKETGASFSVIDHDPVVTTRDVRETLNTDPAAMIKTVVFKDRKNFQFIVVILRADKRVQEDALARTIGLTNRELSFASERDIASLGFPIGGIAPFGFDRQDVRFFVDPEIRRDATVEDFYTGVGDNEKTLKVARQSFLKIIRSYEDLPEDALIPVM